MLIDYIIEGILEKKGREIINIDLTNVQSAVCDNFIICHADSNTQVGAIADSIEKKVLDNSQMRVNHREGKENAQWILLDYNNIIVHIFQKQYRDYYKLEELWGDAVMHQVEESFN